MNPASIGWVVILSSSIAAAQPAPAPVSPPAAGSPASVMPSAPAIASDAGAVQIPGFVAIDRLDGGARAGLDLTYLEPDTKTFSSNKPTLLRFEAHAQYVHQASGLGGYAQVPLSYGSSSGFAGSSTITDFGDIEFGAIFIPKLSIPHVGLVLHAGITAPTGERNDEALIGLIESVTALPELYNILPKGTTLKLGVSPIFRSGNLFARLDLGFDWNIDLDGGSFGNGIHYNLGVGIDLGKVALMLESENLSITNSRPAGSPSNSITFNSIAVSARADAGIVSPYLAVVIPVENDSSQFIDFAITAGADFKL